MGLLIINDISLVKYILLGLPAEITQHILLVWPQEINKEDQCNLCTYSMMKLLGAHTHLDLQASGLHWNLYIKNTFIHMQQYKQCWDKDWALYIF